MFEIFQHRKTNEVRYPTYTNSSGARLAQTIQLIQEWTRSQDHYQRTEINRGATLQIVHRKISTLILGETTYIESYTYQMLYTPLVTAEHGPVHVVPEHPLCMIDE